MDPPPSPSRSNRPLTPNPPSPAHRPIPIAPWNLPPSTSSSFNTRAVSEPLPSQSSAGSSSSSSGHLNVPSNWTNGDEEYAHPVSAQQSTTQQPQYGYDIYHHYPQANARQNRQAQATYYRHPSPQPLEHAEESSGFAMGLMDRNGFARDFRALSEFLGFGTPAPPPPHIPPSHPVSMPVSMDEPEERERRDGSNGSGSWWKQVIGNSGPWGEAGEGEAEGEGKEKERMFAAVEEGIGKLDGSSTSSVPN
ncbi:hypothetical protein BT69DRAFT_696803 [Atractiella rhizophila]|nr:hypothetical protein BT69DRAFT_696803 [Atractiella rhizophila]